MKLVLTAPDGAPSITVPAGADVTTLRLTTDEGPVPHGVVLHDGDATITVLKTLRDEEGLLVDVPFSGSTAAYRAELPSDPEASSDTVTAQAAGDGSGVAEVAIGQYDWPFSLVAGVLLALLAAGILVIAGGAILGVFAPTTTVVDGSTTTTPSTVPLAERLRAAVTIGLFATGSIVLLLGGMMALLEVRGRLRHREALVKLVVVGLEERQAEFGALSPESAASPTAAARIPLKEAVEASSAALATTLGAAKGVRATVVTLVIGLGLLLVAFLGSTTIDFTIDVGGSDPAPTVTPTPDPPAPTP